ncbi:MAG: glycosyltransferase family 2 protein [Planctomycetota bacterium]
MTQLARPARRPPPPRIHRPPLVVVFIPAFNEAHQIATAIAAVKSCFRDPAVDGYQVQVLVVDDGSQDGTADAARAAGADRVVTHPYNLGLGAATRTAIQTAYDLGAAVAVKFDADLQHDAADIARALKPVLEKKAHIVYGSRFAGTIHYRMPFVRRVGNRFFTWLMRRLTGWPITDAQTGLMVYSRTYMEGFNMPGNYNPPHQTLLDAYHRHLTYAEVPVSFRERTSGRSFVSFKYPFKVLPQMVRTVMLVCPLKVFVPLSLLFGGAGLLLATVEILLKLFGATFDVHDATIAVLLSFGVQCLFFGLLADLVISKRHG